MSQSLTFSAGWSVFRTAALAFLLLGPGQPQAGDGVDLALVLAVDVSPSIDAGELRLQREGYAQALSSLELFEAIQSLPGRLTITYFEWSGSGEQQLIVPWTVINSLSDAENIAVSIKMNRSRQFYDGSPFKYKVSASGTALGEAIAFAGALMQFVPTARRKVIDVSGDGMNNDGIEPRPVRDRLVKAGITINGLPILNTEPGLADYYRRHVIGGTLSFVQPVQSFENFNRAVQAKLLAEVAGTVPTRRYALQP